MAKYGTFKYGTRLYGATPPFERIAPEFKSYDLESFQEALLIDESGRTNASQGSDIIPGSSTASVKSNPRYIDPNRFIEGIQFK